MGLGCVSEESTFKSTIHQLTLIRMAMIEIRLAIATLLITYESWSGVPDTDGLWDEEMKPFDSIVLTPRNGKCVLKFERKD